MAERDSTTSPCVDSGKFPRGNRKSSSDHPHPYRTSSYTDIFAVKQHPGLLPTWAALYKRTTKDSSCSKTSHWKRRTDNPQTMRNVRRQGDDSQLHDWQRPGEECVCTTELVLWSPSEHHSSPNRVTQFYGWISSWARGGLGWMLEEISLLKGLCSIGTGCPGQWSSHHPRRS